MLIDGNDKLRNELISVIISVYNIKNYLPRCLETVAGQSYQNIEIIIVDDGSTDGTAAICDEFVKNDNRASVIHQENAGLWAARNAGQRVARGNYLLYVDGDDYLHLDAIKVMYDAINSNDGYDLAMIDRKLTERLDENITAEGKNTRTELSQEQLISNMFCGDDSVLFVYQWNKLYRKELIENLWSNSYMRSQDFDFNFRTYLRVNKAVWVHRELYFYVQRGDSLVKLPEAWILYFDCRSRLLFQNYINLPADKHQYSFFLLRQLYRYLPELKYKYLWNPDKNSTWHLRSKEDVWSFCRDCERATWRAYWKNRRICIAEKMIQQLLLHCPRLTRLKRKLKCFSLKCVKK